MLAYQGCMPDGPYRASTLPETKPEPPSALFYMSSDRERHVGALRSVAQKGILGAIVAVVTSVAGIPALGVIVFAASIAWGAWSWRRSSDVMGVELVVENGLLLVTGSAGIPVRVSLAKLRDVRLDTKEISRVQADPRFALSAFGSPILRVAPPTNVSRIVLDLGKRAEPIELTEAYVSYSECLEWLGKIRRFLRAHGWLPHDERKKRGTSASGEDRVYARATA